MKSLNTFYDTLQVPRNASIAALRTAHKTLSERLQPGSNPEDPCAAATQLLQVNKSLEVLTHPHAREAYDAWLGQRIGAMAEVGVPTLPSLPTLPTLPTLPELVASPSQPSASTAVSSEALTPLPTLDLDGFAAEVAAKARASASAAAATARAPEPLSSSVAKPTATAVTAAKSAALAPPALVPAPPPEPVLQAPSIPSGFAETQPYQPPDVDDLPDLEAPNRKASATAATNANAATSALAPKHPAARQGTTADRFATPLKAFEWLRERPIALVGAVLACVLLVAFAPWLWHAASGVRKAEVPVTAPLQPTYVEPPVEAVSAPVVVVETPEPVEEPVAEPATASKPTQKAPPRKVVKRVAEPKRVQVPIAPVPQPEPVVAPEPVDAGGHTGFAPKCRWVTPTNWSCK